MIKKLRLRLIWVSMLSLVLVLTIIMGVVNILNYVGIVNDADSVLAELKKSDGVLPEIPEDFDWEAAGTHYRSPELPFEIRFFSAEANENGEITASNTDRIAALDFDAVNNYTRRALDTRSNAGFISDYRFIRYVKEDVTHVIFIDCGRHLAGFRHQLFNTLKVCAIGLVAVFVLIFSLSLRIVQPFHRNYENQKRFITDAGHELKTPITIIHADAELLNLEIGDNEWLEDIRLQANRLSDLTHDLISLSQLEEQVSLEMIDFPVSDILQETVFSFQAPAIASGKSFSAHIESGLSMLGNEKSICQLATILLDNALKYASPEGSIEFSLQKKGRSLAISCENTVESVSCQVIENMFERFYRADNSRTAQKQGGYGIGLSIARAIVEAHKGKISAATPADDRIVITAVFPIRQQDTDGKTRKQYMS